MASTEPTTAAPRAFTPFIPAAAQLRELTILPLITGVLLGIVFGASSLYLVLKVGLTVSASIPVAVISITLFRVLKRLGIAKATILENNIVQTAGSAGESIAFGLGVTMPAIMILGFDLEITRVMLVGILGGLLGILMMIPLRRALIVQEHGVLKYPEGTACAEVLKAGATREEHELAAAGSQAQTEAQVSAGARTIVFGFLAGIVYKLAMEAFHLWKDVPEKVFGAPLAKASVAAEISPELLGVGYIIGPRIAATMAAGGVLAYMVLIPAIQFFGSAAGVVIPPGKAPISAMSPGDIRSAYILYIGAGAVTAGGLISLARALPTIWRGLKGGLADFGVKRDAAAAVQEVPRTDRDISLKWVALGVVVLIGAILMAHSLRMNIVGALLIVLFGFMFVTV
ncbi:MAG: oligopeptide transporter protein, partial [Caulobacteraceae bacterium]|nr:oligopeptide transporter protein [Caulobacteraceae bacterium]